MPLLTAYKAVFVHIPKTGGTSVAGAFGLTEDHQDGSKVLYGRDPVSGELWLHHLGIQSLLDTGRLKGCEKWYRFSFVRNPWTRCRSSWLFQKSRGFDVADTLEEHIDDIEAQLKCKLGLFVTDAPQHWFLYGRDGTLLVDALGRFEHLQETFDAICLRLGAPQRKLPFLNETPAPQELIDVSHYTCKMAAKVGAIYREDCIRFGYDSDGLVLEESESVLL